MENDDGEVDVIDGAGPPVAPPLLPDATSASSVVSTAVKGSHRFTVKGFSLTKGMANGKPLTSKTFSVGGHDWAVYFYPEGKNPEDKTYVSVFVALCSHQFRVRALFEIVLVDQSERGKHKVCGHFSRPLERGPYIMSHPGSMWGYKHFYKRTLLETSEYLKDDCLLFDCTVGVVRNHIEAPRQSAISVPSSNMGQCLKEVLLSGLGSDVAFIVGEETFKAHKLVLSARSTVFNAQFYGPMVNPDMDRVVVKDVEPHIFKAMLHFIYTDMSDVHELFESVSICTDTVAVSDLLVVAERYRLDRLKQLCETKLFEDVTTDTVAMNLVLAEQNHCFHLKTACLNFASTCLPAVVQTEGFKHLEHAFPSLLSDLLAMVAALDKGMKPIKQKRSSSSNIGQNTNPTYMNER